MIFLINRAKSLIFLNGHLFPFNVLRKKVTIRGIPLPLFVTTNIIWLVPVAPQVCWSFVKSIYTNSPKKSSSCNCKEKTNNGNNYGKRQTNKETREGQVKFGFVFLRNSLASHHFLYILTLLCRFNAFVPNAPFRPFHWGRMG